MVLITVLIILTIANLILIAYSANQDSDCFANAIIFFIFGTLAMGWGLMGSMISIDEIDSKIKVEDVEIIRSVNFMLVSTNGDVYKFDKKVDFDRISDTTTFLLLDKNNLYGYSVGTSIFYYSYNDSVQRDDKIITKNIKVKNKGKKL